MFERTFGLFRCIRMGVVQKLRKKMYKRLSFKNLLILSNIMSNISGYFCIFIDPVTFTRKKSFLGYLYFTLCFAFSLIANTFKAYVPIATITRSGILEFLYNLLNHSTVYFMCVFKVVNLATNKRLFKVFEDLQWCNLKVFN